MLSLWKSSIIRQLLDVINGYCLTTTLLFRRMKLFQSVYTEAASLAREFSVEEKWSRLPVQQINWNKILSETSNENWQWLVCLPFLDTNFAGMKLCSLEKREHIINSSCQKIKEKKCILRMNFFLFFFDDMKNAQVFSSEIARFKHNHRFLFN